MKEKLQSRKLWIAIGGVISILILEFSGVAVAPEAIAGLAAILATYVFGQSLVDRNVVAEQVKVQGDAGKLQLQLYARNLEQELEKLMAPAELGGTLPFIPDTVE